MDERRREDERNTTVCQTLNLNDSILNLCLKLFRTVGSEGNMCFSPTAIHQILSVLITFSRDEHIKRKLIELLALPENYEPNQLYHAWNEYLMSLQKMKNPLAISLALFAPREVKLTDDSELMVMENKYHGQIFAIEDQTFFAQKINEWIERATDGSTKKIDINFDYVRDMLIGAVSFKDEFHQHMEWELSKEYRIYSFCSKDCTSVRTDFIRTIADIEYAQNSDLQAVKLAYQHPDYYLLLLLPIGTGETNRMENMIVSSPDYLTSLEFEHKLVDVIIPKFVVQNEINVMDMLHHFCPDLKNLQICCQYDVNTIKQVNRMDVHERETVSCSWKNNQRDPDRITFLAMFSFLYMLFHQDKIILTGRICN